MSKQLAPYKNLSDDIVPGGMGWKTDLDRAEKSGAVLPTLPNARRIVSNHPYLRECFAWSEFDEDVMLMRPLPAYVSENLIPPEPNGVYPKRFTDKFLTYLRDILSVFAPANFKGSDVMSAVQNVAVQRTYNPIRGYLESLTWDGFQRVDNWLHDALGAEETDLNRAMGRMFLIAACRRASFRMYKFDSMLVLEGPKGIRKSTACRVLFGSDYFSEGIGDIRKEESIKNLAGMWGVEIPEGKGFFTASAEEQKEFLSKIEDTYRRAYAVRAITVPRRFVMICTTNASEYLKESGGDRRFWSVRAGVCHEPNIQWLKDNRDQLWAEAFHLAMKRDDAGKLIEPTYLGEELMDELTDVQSDRLIGDPWEARISLYVRSDAGSGRNELTTLEIMTDILQIPPDRQDRRAATKVGQIMNTLGWSKVRKRIGASREYVYARPIPGM